MYSLNYFISKFDKKIIYQMFYVNAFKNEGLDNY